MQRYFLSVLACLGVCASHASPALDCPPTLQKKQMELVLYAKLRCDETYESPNKHSETSDPFEMYVFSKAGDYPAPGIDPTKVMYGLGANS